MTAKVFIVDDHPLVRSGVRTELGDAVSVIGEAGDVDGAVKALLALADDALDVVLLDVHMPGGGGVEILRRVTPKKPSLRFLALSVSDAPEDVIAVIRAGARGYITKSATGAEIAEAVDRIAAGDAAFSPRLAGFVLDAFASGVSNDVSAAPPDPELDQLTPRETRSAPTHRPRLRLQGGRPAARRVGQDRRDPRQLGVAKTAIEQPPRTGAVGD